VKVLLLCSSFNGLSQRAWTELRGAGHEVAVQLASNSEAVVAGVTAFDPDVIICPFLKDRVPAEVWRHYRTIIIHPGPPGDRGPSSLDWAITNDEASWGATALQAVDEMDAGPIWGYRTFAMPADPPRKSSLYNGAVTRAAIELVHDVMTKAADGSFQPRPLDYSAPDVRGTLRPLMHQSDREFSWSEPSAAILRRIRAADGSPGVRSTLCGAPVSVYDAHPGPVLTGKPGAVVQRSRGAVLVGTGDGSLWIGQLKLRERDLPKLPATLALGPLLGQTPEVAEPVGYREISYYRTGPVGVLTFDFYNGAMSTGQCERLVSAIRHAASQDTRVLVIRGGEIFSNGIHLNVIEAAPNPELEAWHNINAIDDVCREIITCARQLVVSSVGGNAGAGGVMLALGADEVLLREGVVLNPHYRTMGLFGSEYWTYVLPRRVGSYQAEMLTSRCEPIDAVDAARYGLVDDVIAGSRATFESAVLERALRLATRDDYYRQLDVKRAHRAADERRRPLEVYRTEELAAMSRDIFDDRMGFAAARQAFVMKRPATAGTAAASQAAERSVA